MKKKRFWYPLINIKNRFLFGAYGRDVYIEPGVVINRPRFVHLGDHVRIKRNTSINLHPKDKRSKEGLLFVGNRVIISEGCIISALNRTVIEENVIIGPHVMVIDNTRRPGDIQYPIMDQPLDLGYVNIGANSFIGYNTCILPNVSIGRYSIVGANSVVNRDISSYSVAVGNPVQVIKRYHFGFKKWMRINGKGEFLE